MKKRLLSVLCAAVFAAAAVPSFRAKAADYEYRLEYADGTYLYGFNLYNEGSYTMEPGTNGGFSAEWSDVKSCWFEMHMKCDGIRMAPDPANVTVSYEMDLQANNRTVYGMDGYTNATNYQQFFVIEGWRDDVSPVMKLVGIENRREPLKTVEIDGNLYDLYRGSDFGFSPYNQYYSIRHDNPMMQQGSGHYQGTISLDAHMQAWNSIGAELSRENFSEVRFIVSSSRASDGSLPSGICEVSSISFGGFGNEKLQPDENGILYQQGFEADTGRWRLIEITSDSKLQRDADNAAEGLRSLHVSAGQYDNAGTVFSLAPIELNPDKTYSIQLAVMQNSLETAGICLEGGIDIRNGTQSGENLWQGVWRTAPYAVRMREWTVIRFDFCLSELFPTGDFDVGDMILRLAVVPDEIQVLTEDGADLIDIKRGDFWIDSVTVAEAGKLPEISLSGAFINAPEPKLPADENGIFCYDDFEDGIGEWNKRAYDSDTSVLAADTECYAEGKQSLRVTERLDSWNGAALSLEPYALEPGKAYSFQAAVMQNSMPDQKVKMLLEYIDCFGTKNYDLIAQAECRQNMWTVLRDAAFVIPADSTELILAIHTAEGVDDFRIDSVTVAEAGRGTPIDLSGAKPASVSGQTGDANCDGAVDVSDAVLVMRYAVADREAVISEQGLRNADTDKNGNTDSDDATMILLHIAKKIDLTK